MTRLLSVLGLLSLMVVLIDLLNGWGLVIALAVYSVASPEVLSLSALVVSWFGVTALILWIGSRNRFENSAAASGNIVSRDEAP